MKKNYTVLFTKSFDLNINVECENKDDAFKKADEILNKKTNKELIEKSQESCWEYAYTDEV